MVIAAHLDGDHSHIHNLHDCAWSSIQCKDIILRGVAVKKRDKKYNPLTEEFIAFWNFYFVLYYLYKRGNRFFHLEIGGRVLFPGRYSSGVEVLSSKGLSAMTYIRNRKPLESCDNSSEDSDPD